MKNSKDENKIFAKYKEIVKSNNMDEVKKFLDGCTKEEKLTIKAEANVVKERAAMFLPDFKILVCLVTTAVGIFFATIPDIFFYQIGGFVVFILGCILIAYLWNDKMYDPKLTVYINEYMETYHHEKKKNGGKKK